MFPSIENQRGIQAVHDILNTPAIKKLSTDCLIEGLKLYNNNSVSANENLLQTNRTATGAPNSCSYVDIAVASTDEAIMKQKEAAFPGILYFGRYRDDCLVQWDDRDEKLQELYSFINPLNPDLTFTMEVGNQPICFLNLRISIVGNKLTTTVYNKPTDSHLNLHADSYHKKPSVKSIQKNVALRLRRICSSNNDYIAKSKEYTKYLVNMEHDLTSIHQCFNNVGKTSRQEAQKKIKLRNAENLIVFSTSFHPHGPNVKKIRNKAIHLLLNNDNLKELYPKGTILVASKEEKNFQQLLMRSHSYNIKDDQQSKEDCGGYTKCSYKYCDSCNNFVAETTYTGFNTTDRKYKIRRDTTCYSINVIYVAYCIKYMRQGFSSTTSWKPQLSNYKSHVKKEKLTCSIIRHFIENCNDNVFKNLRFTVVDCLNNADGLTDDEIDDLLLKKEKFWIRT